MSLDGEVAREGEFHLEAPDKSHTLINLMEMGSADFEDGVNGEVAWQNNPQMGATVTVQLSDYREVDGVTLAYRIDQGGPMPAIVE